MDFEIEKNEKENKKENNNDKKSKIVMGGTTAVLVIGGIFVYNTLSDKENNEPPIKTEQAVKAPSLEEKTNEEFEEKDKDQIEGDLGVVSEGFKKFSEMNSYRFTYSIKGQYQEERIIMDNTITGKYDNQLGYIKQFTTNNKEQLSYNVMYDVEKKENFYNKNEVITKLDQSIANGLLENYEWVSLKEDEISDRNIFLTKMNFSEKRKLLLEMEDGKLYTQTLTEQDILEGVSKIFVYKTDKEDLNKIRSVLTFLNEDQKYIDVTETDEVNITFKVDMNGNLVSEKYDLFITKTTGLYRFQMEQKYSNFNENLQFTENLNQNNVVTREMVETIKKQAK